MNRVNIYMHGVLAGVFSKKPESGGYCFQYTSDYQGPPISLTMPVRQQAFDYETFPPFFDGLLPEGLQLEGLLKLAKIDRNDYFAQLVTVGSDLVGAVTVEEINAF